MGQAIDEYKAATPGPQTTAFSPSGNVLVIERFVDGVLVTIAKSQTPVPLVEPAKQKSRRATRWLIAVAIAASILTVVALRRPANDSLYVVKPNPPVTQQEHSFDAEWISESPTLWACHRKADQTPEALDDLLVSHAREFRVSGAPMSVFRS